MFITDTRVCPEKYFLCTNRRCIETGRHCNGIDDCGDNSDELNCASGTACPAGHFACSNGHCISESKVFFQLISRLRNIVWLSFSSPNKKWTIFQA